MNSSSWPERMDAGDWHWQRATGELHGPGGIQRLEPKVMDLLCLLAQEPGRVWSREQLLAALWPGLVVGDDSLARTVSKLRQALEDDAKAPRWIETIAKRGYRWIGAPTAAVRAQPGAEKTTAERESANRSDLEGVPTQAQVSESDAARTPSATPVSEHQVGLPRRWTGRLAMGAAVMLTMGLLGLLWHSQTSLKRSSQTAPTTDTSRLLARADDYYFQFSRADNEAALELYQRVLGMDPEHPIALAGLANALTQRAIRWPTAPGPDAVEFTRLSDARRSGHLDREPALSQLRRARQLAESAVAHAPESAAAYKALGLVASAQGELVQGLQAHQRAVALDPQAWPAMINLADVLEQLERADEALPWFERAYAAMEMEYARNPAQVRHWQEALGVLIADRWHRRGKLSAAETWYRRVLTISPLHPDATRGLAAVLQQGGDADAAARLCAELQQRLGPEAACQLGP